MFRGIGEELRTVSSDPVPRNMCGNLYKYLDPAEFVLIDVPWSATYGPAGSKLLNGDSYDVALRQAYGIGMDTILQLPPETPFFVVGYSGGAAAAGSLVSSFLRDNDMLAGVGLVADPLSPGDFPEPGMPHGISGKRKVMVREGVPVWDLADPNDVIPRCDFPSPLRTFADQSAAFSLADPAAWHADLLDRLKKGRWQPSAWDWLDPIGSFKRYARAVEQATGYLRPNGDHVSYDKRTMADGRTYIEQLGHMITKTSEVLL